MRHGRKIKRLGRPSAARRALLRSMATSLFQHGRIITTLPKAKGLRPFAERLITRAKKGVVESKSGLLHAKRLVMGALFDRDVVAKLFTEIAPKYKDRNGGYTRIMRLGRRLGDNATQAIIELV